MTSPLESIEQAIKDVDRIRRLIKRYTKQQIRKIDDRLLIKASALAWFNNYRQQILLRVISEDLMSIDELYKELLSYTEYFKTTSTYQLIIGNIHSELCILRARILTTPPPTVIQTTQDTPPSFNKLITDPKMQSILERRWHECNKCISGNAPLAAIVMMGGLLEGLLLAKITSQPNLSPVFTSTSAPKNKNTGNPLSLNEWTLRNYIDVAHELGWISQSAHDVSVVLRDYRNYVHPQKEYSHGIVVNPDDSKLLWEVTKSIIRQLL